MEKESIFKIRNNETDTYDVYAEINKATEIYMFGIREKNIADLVVYSLNRAYNLGYNRCEKITVDALEDIKVIIGDIQKEVDLLNRKE